VSAAEAAATLVAGTHSRQAVLVEPGRLELREYVAPHPGPGELLIQIRCALSCGTDLKTFRRGHPLWKLPMPFGHEFSGVVLEAGAGVTAFRAGQEIMAAPTAPCGICFYCQHRQENLCDDAVGRMVHGAYADTLLLPAHIVARNTFIKPAELPFEEAALLEPLSCVVHAQEMARPEKNETAVILGGGAFGLLHMLMLKAAGLREVAVVGRGAERLKWAVELGADRVIDARSSDAVAEIARLNGGFGPDLVIECTGQVEGWHDALSRVRRGGRVVFFGGCAVGTSMSVDTRRMHCDNLTLMAPFHYRPRDVRRAYELLAGRALNAGAIVNARMPLGDLAEVFAMLERGVVLKCAVIP
jgi:L-iditol 2-dehydrogenase